MALEDIKEIVTCRTEREANKLMEEGYVLLDIKTEKLRKERLEDGAICEILGGLLYGHQSKVVVSEEVLSINYILGKRKEQ